MVRILESWRQLMPIISTLCCDAVLVIDSCLLHAHSRIDASIQAEIIDVAYTSRRDKTIPSTFKTVTIFCSERRAPVTGRFTARTKVSYQRVPEPRRQ